MIDNGKSVDTVPQNTSQWRIMMFYIPLAIQALSQSLTYPLVASIVSHGRFGAHELAAFAQGQSLMFVMGAVGGGLITTGMVFARTKSGMENYGRLVMRIAVVVAVLQLATCLPPFHRLIFSRVLGLNDELASVARWTMLLGIPLQFAFFLRNKHVVALYNEKKSGLANAATLARIFATACLSPLFLHLGWTGYIWGSVAMTLPVFGEAYLSKVFARPYLEKLTDGEFEEIAPLGKQLHFTLPLSFGGMMLALSGFMVAIFLSRADNPEVTLAVHYIIMGVINPLGFAALRMQSVVIAFPSAIYGARKIAVFSLLSGLLLSVLPLAFQVPGIAEWYFGTVQNLPSASVRLACNAVLMISALPLLQSLRGHAEGLAALRRRPNAILSGQAVYLATMVISLLALLSTKVLPGYLMGVAAIQVALAMSLMTVHAGLVWSDFEDSYGNPSRRVPEADTTVK